jgi:hypothetical protein
VSVWWCRDWEWFLCEVHSFVIWRIFGAQAGSCEALVSGELLFGWKQRIREEGVQLVLTWFDYKGFQEHRNILCE